MIFVFKPDVAFTFFIDKKVNKTAIIFDDTNAVHISKILNEYCEKNFIKEIDYSEDLKKCFFHRIFKYQSV